MLLTQPSVSWRFFSIYLLPSPSPLLFIAFNQKREQSLISGLHGRSGPSRYAPTPIDQSPIMLSQVGEGLGG